jgi:hypothetical protein
MTSGMTSALTPALSPRRGRIIHRVLSHAMCRVVVRLTANCRESVTAMRIEKLSDNVTVRPLSPGERAGVRASENAHFTENVEEAETMDPCRVSVGPARLPRITAHADIANQFKRRRRGYLARSRRTGTLTLCWTVMAVVPKTRSAMKL